MKIIECAQGSKEWFAARRGLPTASAFGRIITAKTEKLAAAHDDYIDELIAEVRRTGEAPERYQNAAMKNGESMEAQARKWYETVTDHDVQQVGFCLSDCGRYGCSPDGLIGTVGGLEIKCPTGKVHCRYLRAGGLPDEHKAQVHGNLLVTGREWWDFVSYCPGWPTLCVRVERDGFTTTLATVLEKFLATLTAERNRVAKLEAA